MIFLNISVDVVVTWKKHWYISKLMTIMFYILYKSDKIFELTENNMSYKDIRINSFNLSPRDLNALYESRYNGESTIRLGFDINGFDSFVVLNPDLLNLMSSIYQLDKKLALLSNQLPEEALYQFKAISMLEEIQQSNEVENVQSTKKEIKDAYNAVKLGKQNKRFASMIKKYLLLQSDIEIPLNTCQQIRDLYDDFILDEVVKDDPNDQPDGVIFRQSTVKVLNSHNEVIHEGLYPESNIIIAMNRALAILNNHDYDILIRTALFHYFFGFVHPFYNGNGRMTRFISSYMFSKYFSQAACLRISYVINQNRRRYYELFRNANDKRNKGELTEFVTGYLTFFKDALKDTYVTLEEKNMLYKEYEGILNDWLKNNMSKISATERVCFKYLLQAELFGESTLDINNVSKFMECSEKTARKILADAGQLVYSTKEGRKLIWHINVKFLASLGEG